VICQVCKCHRLHLIEARGRRKELSFDSNEPVEVQYSSCKCCGLVSKWPRPSEETLRHYYEKAWQSEMQRPWKCISSAASWVARVREPYVTPTTQGLVSALDVGAKDTALLDAIETFIPIHRKLAKDPHPVEAEASWVGSGPETDPPESYDLVASTHVLEHVADIEGFLAHLGNLVARNGLLYVEVPALEGSTYCTENIHRAHLWHFPLQALAHLATHGVLASQGFQVIGLETDTSVDGWPVNRMLLRRSDSLLHIQGGHMAGLWTRQERLQEEQYIRALQRLDAHKPAHAVLYGACETLLQLAHYGASRGPRLGGFRLVDFYKSGQDFFSWRVDHPDTLEGMKVALITTRNWTSIESIRGYLSEKHTGVAVEALFDA
jgi:hypothetical protein